MLFYGYHGVLSEERILGQEFKVSIEIFVPLEKAGKNDDLTKTINYAEVYQVVQNIILGEPVSLLETLAEKIASRVLAYDLVEGVRIEVEKSKPPIPGIMEGVKICILREKK